MRVERGEGATAAPSSPSGHAQDCAVSVDTVGDVTVCPLLAWGPEAAIHSAQSGSASNRRRGKVGVWCGSREGRGPREVAGGGRKVAPRPLGCAARCGRYLPRATSGILPTAHAPAHLPGWLEPQGHRWGPRPRG